MWRRVIKKIQWADNNIMSSLLKVLYFNVIKKNRFEIFEYDLLEEIETYSLNSQQHMVRVIHCNELASMIAGKKNLPREFRMHEIDGVTHCVLVMVGDKIGHIVWIYKKGDPDRWFDLGNDEVHINYGYTFPEYRGMGLWPQALLGAAKWLKDRNYKRIMMDVHKDTKFMLRSMKKIKGVKHIGSLTHWFIYRPKFKRGKSTGQ